MIAKLYNVTSGHSLRLKIKPVLECIVLTFSKLLVNFCIVWINLVFMVFLNPPGDDALLSALKKTKLVIFYPVA